LLARIVQPRGKSIFSRQKKEHPVVEPQPQSATLPVSPTSFPCLPNPTVTLASSHLWRRAPSTIKPKRVEISSSLFFLSLLLILLLLRRRRPGRPLQLKKASSLTLFFFCPVQTGLPRELAESLARATQPGLVSPGCSDQAQRYHPASLCPRTPVMDNTQD